MKKTTFLSRRRRARGCLQTVNALRFRLTLRPFGMYGDRDIVEHLRFWLAEYLGWRDSMYA